MDQLPNLQQSRSGYLETHKNIYRSTGGTRFVWKPVDSINYLIHLTCYIFPFRDALKEFYFFFV